MNKLIYHFILINLFLLNSYAIAALPPLEITLTAGNPSREELDEINEDFYLSLFPDNINRELYSLFEGSNCKTRENRKDKKIVNFHQGRAKDFRSVCNMNAESKLTVNDDWTIDVESDDRSNVGRSLYIYAETGAGAPKRKLLVEWVKVKRGGNYDYVTFIHNLKTDKLHKVSLKGSGKFFIDIGKDNVVLKYGSSTKKISENILGKNESKIAILKTWEANHLDYYRNSTSSIDVVPSNKAAQGFALLEKVDIRGFDFSMKEMQRGQHNLCAQECSEASYCEAYTWVKEGEQGDLPRCYFKANLSSHVRATLELNENLEKANCCTSGLRRNTKQYFGTMEVGVDLRGRDFSHFELPYANASLCSSACAQEDHCKAFTYVEPGFQGEKAQCYLKDAVPERTLGASCCSSGIKSSALTLNTIFEDRDFLGDDIEKIVIAAGGFDACVEICDGRPDCNAITYEKTTEQNSDGVCYIKHGNGTPVRDTRFDSSLTLRGDDNRIMQPTLVNKNIPGDDYHNFGASSVQVCSAACGADNQCGSFSFVKEPSGHAGHCWLKNELNIYSDYQGYGSSALRSASIDDNCCDSGHKRPSYFEQIVVRRNTPDVLRFSANSNNRMILGMPFPEDMPPVKFPKGFDDCTSMQDAEIKKSWVMAHHHTWRVQQLLNYLDSVGVDKGRLWDYRFSTVMKTNSRYNNYTPRGWLGQYEGDHFKQAKETINRYFDTRFLKGNKFAMSCEGKYDACPKAAQHVVFRNVKFCDKSFDDLTPDPKRDNKSQTRLLLHELFHHLRNPKGIIMADNHHYWEERCDYKRAQRLQHDKAAYIGMFSGCSSNWNYKIALRNVDNFAYFISEFGSRVYDGSLRTYPSEDFNFTPRYQ